MAKKIDQDALLEHVVESGKFVGTICEKFAAIQDTQKLLSAQISSAEDRFTAVLVETIAADGATRCTNCLGRDATLTNLTTAAGEVNSTKQLLTELTRKFREQGRLDAVSGWAKAGKAFTSKLGLTAIVLVLLLSLALVGVDPVSLIQAMYAPAAKVAAVDDTPKPK